MSGWGMGWFGGGGGGTTAAKKKGPKDAILQLRGTMEMLTKREKHLQSLMDEQSNIARQNAKSNPNLAKAALRRKKQHEKSLEQTSNHIFTVEQQISSIETASINKETFDAMTNATKAMKEIHGPLSTDKVDAAMEELANQHAIGEEIAEALTTGAQTTGALDEEDLEAELADLQQEQLDNKVLDTGISDVAQKIPSAGAGPLKAKATAEDEEEEELKRLQAEMAMN